MCQETRNHKSIESLEQSLDRVNAWIGNCDQKAGFLLATIGVIMAILFTSDFVGDVKLAIIDPFVKYWSEDQEQYEFCLKNLLFSATLISTMGLSAISAFFALSTISATISAKKIKDKNPTIVSNSFLFFQSISSMEYEDFLSDREIDYQADLMSQIYINSTICTIKFKKYQIALRCFYGVIASIPFMYVLYLFIKL